MPFSFKLALELINSKFEHNLWKHTVFLTSQTHRVLLLLLYPFVTSYGQPVTNLQMG